MHQDYIVRMMQQMAIFITRVFKLRTEGEFEAAYSEIISAYGHLTGLPASLVHGLSEEDLLVMLSSRGALPVDRCIGLAELLSEEAEVLRDQGYEDDAVLRDLKALRFYLEALRESEDLRAADLPGLDEVVARMSWYPVAEPTRNLLLPYLDETGQFDQLENVLVAWMDADDSGEAEQAAVDIYRNLLAKPDAELIVGGLVRAEIEEALAELTDDQVWRSSSRSEA